MAACDNWAGLMVQRTMLGALEGCVYTGFSLVTAMWYRKYEHVSRTGIWTACVSVASIVSGAIAYGCVAGYEAAPNTTFTSWKILLLFITASWLSEEDRVLAIERLRQNHQGVGSTQFKRYQFKEAGTDYRPWLYVLFLMSSQLPAAGLVLLNPILVKILGCDTKTSLLLATHRIGQHHLQLWLWLACGQDAQVTAGMHPCHLLAIFGVALFVGLGAVSPLHARIGQLVGYYIMSGTSATAWFIVIFLMSSNVLGHTKKTSSSLIVLVALGLTYFIGPLCFTVSPYYHKAKAMTLGLWALSILLLGLMWYMNCRDNRARDREMAEKVVTEQAVASSLAFHDLTDMENKGFRYVT